MDAGPPPHADEPIAADALAAAWPLYGLRIRSERLTLRLPTDEDLLALIALARSGIHPPDEMPFAVAWSVLPSPAFERGFLAYHWVARGSWAAAAWDLNLIVEQDGRIIGAQSLIAEQFPVHRIVDTGSWLGQPFQGRGLGKEMRAAGLAFAFDGLGARVARSSAYLDNARSIGVSRSLGYEDDGIGVHAPQGVSRDTQRFRMTEALWRSRHRPKVTIEGLDACLDLFGLDPDGHPSDGGPGTTSIVRGDEPRS